MVFLVEKVSTEVGLLVETLVRSDAIRADEVAEPEASWLEMSIPVPIPAAARDEAEVEVAVW